jgi:hypothetical protein
VGASGVEMARESNLHRLKLRTVLTVKEKRILAVLLTLKLGRTRLHQIKKESMSNQMMMVTSAKKTKKMAIVHNLANYIVQPLYFFAIWPLLSRNSKLKR